ncbi:MAG: 16S rRNA (cytosine(967)-C(5))-methyltransferase RsmB [Lachnospirales bacterium]
MEKEKNFINEREIATNIIMDINRDNVFNNIAIKNALSNHDLTSGQRNTVTEIVNGVLRNKIYLEYCINKISKTNTTKMKPFILALLLCGVYEIFFMSAKNAFVCNEAVNLAKKKGYKNLAPFVNGVLRNIIRAYEKGEFEIEMGKDKLQSLSLKYSYPKWLVGYWNKYYGDNVQYICSFLNTPPKVSIAINNKKVTRVALKSKLTFADIEVVNGEVSKNSLLLKNTRDLRENDSFKKGEFWVMDESSQRAMEYIDFSKFNKNFKVLDLCAAPGGKSFFIKSIVDEEVHITSCDIYEHKLELLEDGFKRLGFSNYDIVLNDATKRNESFVNNFDCVLVDAPCSGFGLLRKKPDIKYSKEYEDILDLQKLQLNILTASKDYVKDNGVIVYSTCTISPLENEMVIEEFLKENKSFEKEYMETILPMDKQIDKGFECDGFFVAILRKVSENG